MAHALNRELNQALQGLSQVEARRGLLRTVSNSVILNGLLALTLWTSQPPLFALLAVATSLFYCYVMITTHDAIHHTLTGWFYFDEIVPRCFAYFVFWPHGLYAELHKLHHKLNGRDPADPERPTPTLAEFQGAGPLGRFVMRHQLVLSLFVFGGIGMLYRHVRAGLRFWPENRQVRVAMVTDAIGITASAMIVFPIVLALGVGWRFAIYILVLERIIGFWMQLRAYIEHYGLAGTGESLVATRLINSRNIKTHALVSRFFNRLNYHSVHHAFPRVPFYHLPEAHARVARLCAAAGIPLPEGEGYFRTCLTLANHPVALDDQAVRPLIVHGTSERAA